MRSLLALAAWALAMSASAQTPTPAQVPPQEQFLPPAPAWSGASEELIAPADRLTAMPESMPFDEAAAFLMTYGTSYYGLKDRGRLQAGETLLVLGAAGGVGLAAVELGRAMGARVVAAASSEEKVQVAKDHGADVGVVYPRGPFDKEGRKALANLFKEAVGPEGAHVTYDGVGGDYAEAAIRASAWDGRFLVIGFPAGIPSVPLNLTLLKSCNIIGVFWGAAVARDPQAHQVNVRELMDLYTSGKIKPFVSERFPLERAGEAIAHLHALWLQGALRRGQIGIGTDVHRLVAGVPTNREQVVAGFGDSAVDLGPVL